MYWCFGRLQWCWAQLETRFPRADRQPPPDQQNALGRDLMRPITLEMFALWKKCATARCRARHLPPPHENRSVKKIDALLLRGYCNTLTYGFCQEPIEHKDNLWTFVDDDRIEPTNNAAEQALRHAVIWRKLSFGTQSAAGSQFVERLLTVIETCRRQRRNTFAWLHRNGSRSSNRPYHAFFVDRGVNDYVPPGFRSTSVFAHGMHCRPVGTGFSLYLVPGIASLAINGHPVGVSGEIRIAVPRGRP